MIIALFKPAGVTYTKQEVPKNAQAFTGYTGQDGPHTLRKPPMAWNGPIPSVRPPVSLEAQMVCTSIVENAVASSSVVMLNVPLSSCLERMEQCLEHDARQKAKRSKTWHG